MRVQTARLIDLGRALGQALTRTPEDAYIEVPPSVQLVAQLPEPLRKASLPQPANVTIVDTRIFGVHVAQNGADGGGQTSTGVILDKGLWQFDGQFIVAWSGAGADLKAHQLQYVDHAGNVGILAQVSALGQAGTYVIPLHFVLNIQDSVANTGPRFNVQSGATVAGDQMVSDFRVL